jgi:lysophospholipase L1-like esterase
MRKIIFVIVAFLLPFGVITATSPKKPTVFTIGDSTVKNGQGDGAGGVWGWGDPIRYYFDLEKINHENHARGGTSSRTFRTLGLWEPVLNKLKKGDYVLIQFGHNDAGPLNDDQRARGTIPGIGGETENIDNLLTGKKEVVHTYGWYLKKYIREIKSKKAIPIVVAPIPRNKWENGSVQRNNNSYGLWAKQVALSERVLFIDLNDKLANAMEKAGEQNVTGELFFAHDHTHPTAKGAVLCASLIVESLKDAGKCKLKNFLLKYPNFVFPVKKSVFLIGYSTVADGNDSVVGWGKLLPCYVDTTRIEIINKARGGRSSRTFFSEGLWAEVEKQLQPGDFLLIQFGHNDGGPVDREKYRGSLPGTGQDTQVISYPDGRAESVHSFGWYIRHYVDGAKSKGAVPIVFSHIPRNKWPNGKVERCNNSYGLWSKERSRRIISLFYRSE